MVLCAGTKRNGEGCTATVEPPQRYCWWHDPANADERRRAASKGGRGKPSREIRDLKKDVRKVIDDVLAGEVLQGPGAVALQGYNTLLRATKVELDIREQQELVERLEALEQAAEGRRGGRGWGA